MQLLVLGTNPFFRGREGDSGEEHIASPAAGNWERVVVLMTAFFYHGIK